jgi:hypothetical protein
MKRTILVFLAAGLLMTGCGGGSVPVEKLAEKLGKLKVNTADKPYTVKLDNTVNIIVKGSDINKAVKAEGKYVILDLSACSATDNTLPSMSIIQDNTFLVGLVLPNGLTTIGADAFDKCEHLTSITIPASVVSISGETPENAFDGCVKLASVTVAPGNPSFSSADGVLFTKDKTTLLFFPEGKGGSYVIPASVTGIEKYAFAGCEGLTDVTISSGVTSIGEGAFSSCTGLTSITIPAGITSIGPNAFSSCSGLTSITIPDGVTSIGERAFAYCSELTSVTIPASIASIGREAFKGCPGFTSVTIPASVTSVGRSAFESCKNLIIVTFESGSSIDRKNFGDYAFNADGSQTWSYDPADLDNALRNAYLSGGAGMYTRDLEKKAWKKN